MVEDTENHPGLDPEHMEPPASGNRGSQSKGGKKIKQLDYTQI